MQSLFPEDSLQNSCCNVAIPIQNELVFCKEISLMRILDGLHCYDMQHLVLLQSWGFASLQSNSLFVLCCAQASGLGLAFYYMTCVPTQVLGLNCGSD